MYYRSAEIIIIDIFENFILLKSIRTLEHLQSLKGNGNKNFYRLI